MPPRSAYAPATLTRLALRPLLMPRTYFFVKRPRFSERKFAGTNSPSFRISLPSK